MERRRCPSRHWHIVPLLLIASQIVCGFGFEASVMGKRRYTNTNRIYDRSCRLQQPTGRFIEMAMSNIDSHDDESNAIRVLRAMKIQDIIMELKKRNVSIQDVFEKEELIRRLLSARKEQEEMVEATSTVVDSSVKYTGISTPTTKTISNNNVISTQLFLTAMDSGTRISSKNSGSDGIIIDPTPQPYVTMKIKLPSSKAMNYKNEEEATLSLLVDTACSGFVLSPKAMSKHRLPSYSTPVTMQGAAGIQQATGLTQIQSFELINDDSSTAKTKPTSFGPLPAAVQDIYGLPSVLDGIIGLSFINQFAAIEFDFDNGRIRFYKDTNSIPNHQSYKNDAMIVDTNLNLIGSYGIYTVPVYIGGRGPVNMLLDTGASCTLLNWKGVNALGLSQSSKQVTRTPIPTGAMGSDNAAIELTHRLCVSSTIHIGETSTSNLPGIQLATSSTRIPIDIGRIPVIENLGNNYNIGGILGMDVLIKCRILRLSTRNSSTARLTLFQ